MSQIGDEYETGALEEIMALARSGDRAEARRRVLGLVRQYPDDVVALLWLAYTSDKVEEVEAVLSRVLLLDPYNEKALEWQILIQQKQMRLRAGQTGTLAPLPPTPPVAMPSPGYPRSNLNSGTLSKNSPAQPNSYLNSNFGPTNNNQATQPYRATSQPLANWTPQNAQYRVMIEPGAASNSARPYVQSVTQPKPRHKWWLVTLVGVMLSLVLGLTLFLLVLNPGRAKPGLSEYRLFTSLDELINEGFVDERVAIDTRFMGGYSKDNQGTYLLILSESRTKSTLYVQWNEAVASMNDFRPGQYITLYGRLTGVGNGKGTLKLDRVTTSG